MRLWKSVKIFIAANCLTRKTSGFVSGVFVPPDVACHSGSSLRTTALLYRSNNIATTIIVKAIRTTSNNNMNNDNVFNENNTTSSRSVIWKTSTLFGRLPKYGCDFLLRNGFLIEEEEKEKQHCKERQRLTFVWPNKTGPQFELNDMHAPSIRPYPKHITDMLDDKITLSKLIKNSDYCNDIMPPYIEHIDDAIVNNNVRYFMKHRWGVKGKSVYVCENIKDLYDKWWNKSNNRYDFLVQQEIIPTLWKNKKFVLRTHILILHSKSMTTYNDDSNKQQQQQQQQKYQFQAFLNRDIICQEHKTEYTCSNQKSAHVSQADNKHPISVLVSDLDKLHPAANVLEKMVQTSKQLAQLIRSCFPDNIASNNDTTTTFALIGVDSLIDEIGQIKICEVNSHPALGWGTMSKVPKQVYIDLIENTLSVLVLQKNPNDHNFITLL